MMNAINSSGTTASPDSAIRPTSKAEEQQVKEVRQAFQNFVAGTFYKQMLKSLHKMHDKPAYFHGGQAEEIFRGQLDQQVAEDLAARQGEALSQSLFRAFAQQLRLKLDSQNRTSSPATKTPAPSDPARV